MKRRKNTFALPPRFPFKLYRVDSGLLFVWPKCFFIFTIKSVTYFLFYSTGCVADTMGLVPAFIIYHSNKVECVNRGSPGRLPAHYSLADLWFCCILRPYRLFLHLHRLHAVTSICFLPLLFADNHGSPPLACPAVVQQVHRMDWQIRGEVRESGFKVEYMVLYRTYIKPYREFRAVENRTGRCVRRLIFLLVWPVLLTPWPRHLWEKPSLICTVQECSEVRAKLSNTIKLPRYKHKMIFTHAAAVESIESFH